MNRAAPKGAGSVKAAGNYAPCFQIQQASKKAGYDEVLFLDAKEDKYVEEAGASNFFCVTPDDTIHTPALRGTILPGVTRKSLIHLAREKGIKVRTRANAAQRSATQRLTVVLWAPGERGFREHRYRVPGQGGLLLGHRCLSDARRLRDLQGQQVSLQQRRGTLLPPTDLFPRLVMMVVATT